MLRADSDPSGVLWESFQTFLRHAVAAQQDSDAKAREIWLRAASYLHPIDDAAIDTLVERALSLQRADNALQIAQVCADLAPHNANAQFRVGLALQRLHRHQDAIAPYRRAFTIAPDLPSLRNNLAGALSAVDRTSAEAVSLLEIALEKDPADVNARLNLARMRLASMDLEGALLEGQRALELAPDSAIAHGNYAHALREAQRWDEAEHHATVASQLAPDEPSFRSNLGMLHLTRGNYFDGWREHESRWQGSLELRGSRPALPGPMWTGEPLAGKTLLVWGEQGMGDLLQFCRYIPLLAERVHREGGRLVWNSFPQMGSLLVRSLGEHVDQYTSGGGADTLPPFDYEIPLLTLPLVFETRVDSIPATRPYLKPDAAAAARWRERLAGDKRLKVGLAWTGSHGHQRNPYRRVGWERYAAYFGKAGRGGLENVAFYSLQPGATGDVAAARSAGLDIVD
jgi:Flp pilus assembly protein TadD